MPRDVKDAGGTTPEAGTFEIGLVLAGAISAGAYTAGVMDFLMEALDAIDDVRAGRDVSYLRQGFPDEAPIFSPPHRLKIKAMSGASAGGMVAAIATATFGAKIDPVAGPKPPPPGAKLDNPFYDSWVRSVGIQAMLETSDIEKSETLISLLNAEDLRIITAKALAFAQHTERKRDYLSEQLAVFLCLGNQRGVRYALPLRGAPVSASEHEMSMHADYVTFCYGRGTQPVSPCAVPLNAGQLTNWATLGDAALASGAFPIGLAAQVLERDFSDYTQRAWLVASGGEMPVRRQVNGMPMLPADDPASWRSPSEEMQTLSPLDGARFKDGKRYSFVSVDGGLFDNEPLELARLHLADGGRNPRRPEEANRAVILIDPFPDMSDFDEAYSANSRRDLVSVAQRLLPSLIAQARFKPSELALASHENSVVASRFVILPVRYDAADNPETYGIASGSLGGFGGFLSQEFRHHDYMLGRRNCQRFLDNVFLLPADEAQGIVNPLMRPWSDPVTRQAFVRRQAMVKDGPHVDHLPIVPLLGRLGSPSYTEMPPWPSAPNDITMADLRKRIMVRAEAVKTQLVAQFKPGTLLRVGIELVWRFNKTSWIESFVLAKVREDLKKRKIQIPEA